MNKLEPRSLLELWERGAQATNATRALLLMQAALPHVERDALVHASVGSRDAWLLTLREALFGSRIECLLPCPACGQRIELDFRVSDVRSHHAAPGQHCEVARAGSTHRFRVPTSADLLAIERQTDAPSAERQLLLRLWQPAGGVSGIDPVPEWMEDVAADVARAIGEADAQAEVLLHLSCPGCGCVAEHIFDIAAHVWCELDHWARAMLRKVHALASRYGWSEDAIVGMSPVRRQAYLGLIGEA